ncbi:hypothetical protein [Rhodohalobacter sp. SW132]|uniref:hypothetical protein n=1 Tax=Rhodohalobacter sp. SW132 TaxID=2293433 RepID=UPI001AE09C77|nr:hypothetical protein [Rhodohalobacter sp. SW132]
MEHVVRAADPRGLITINKTSGRTEGYPLGRPFRDLWEGDLNDMVSHGKSICYWLKACSKQHIVSPEHPELGTPSFSTNYRLYETVYIPGVVLF